MEEDINNNYPVDSNAVHGKEERSDIPVEKNILSVKIKINELENLITDLKETTNTASQSAKKRDAKVLALLKQSSNQFEIIKGESRIVFALAVGLGSSILSIAMFSVLNILDEKALINKTLIFAMGAAVSIAIMSIHKLKLQKLKQLN